MALEPACGRRISSNHLMSQRSKGKIPRASLGPQKPGFVAGQGANAPSRLAGRWPAFAVCVLLALAVWLVFGQTIHHQFVNYDNDIYVYENPDISAGLSLKGILWAFTHVHVDEWWPLNSVSHMLDCELYGLNPGGHHLTNVLLHAATVIGLFLLLRNLTGALWRCAFVAAVFAIHPLRVESVAWVTERKDVLSGLFFVLTLGAYVRYVRKSEVGNQRSETHSPPSVLRPLTSGAYWLALFFFTLGLLSKSTLVTMPFLLLLLDWWPLQRVPGVRGQGSGCNLRPPDLALRTSTPALLLEKVPFLLLAVASCVTTILAVNGIHSVEQLSFATRTANAVVAYATYLKQMLYPVDLAVFYPHPENRLSPWTVGFSALALLVISGFAFAGWRKRPCWLVGWLWYLGMLVPVVGLLQVGGQAYADRYTYLPQIGVYLMVAWGVAELGRSWPYRRVLLGAGAVLVLAVLGIRAHDQTRYWRDSLTLWTHTLDCTKENHLAHLNLGATLADQGKLDEAIAHYQLAVQIKPQYAEAHYNLGVALAAQGKSDEAIARYEQALRFKPDYADAHNNLGNALLAQGRLSDAVQHYQRAIQFKPLLAEGHYNLGNALTRQGRLEEAMQSYRRAVEIRPGYADAHFNWANRLAEAGRLDEAIEHYQQAIRLKPGSAEAHNNLANKLAAQKKFDAAARHYEQAIRLRPDYAEACNNYGVTLAGQGKLEEAIQLYERARELKPDYAQACANLGNVLALKGNPDAALQHLHEALTLATAQTNTALAQAILARLKSFEVTREPQNP